MKIFNNLVGRKRGQMLDSWQQNYRTVPSNHYTLNMSPSSSSVININNSFNEPKAIDNAILSKTFLQASDPHQRDESILSDEPVIQDHSITVNPVSPLLDLNLPMVSENLHTQSDFEYQPKLLSHNIMNIKQIQIKSQPRSRFRPRTENESKISAHYLRCEDNVEQDYPTVYIPQTWKSQSSVNIIQVSLVDIQKQPHPYRIINKSSKEAFDEEALIFKLTEPNTLYFRVTADDFQQGHKTFMIELIKIKQSGSLTKRLIRMLQLDQSMLRFIRIYQDEHGQYQEELASEQYSVVMQENYGDVSVEHMGPQFGPVYGQEMMFIVLKGRILKNELSIFMSEPISNWSEKIEKFTLNGSVIYFAVPAFPNQLVNRVQTYVSIYHKNQLVHESTYLYINLLDKELTDCIMNESSDNIDTSISLNTFDNVIFNDNDCRPFINQEVTKTKRVKRLSKTYINP